MRALLEEEQQFAPVLSLLIVPLVEYPRAGRIQRPLRLVVEVEHAVVAIVHVHRPHHNNHGRGKKKTVRDEEAERRVRDTRMSRDILWLQAHERALMRKIARLSRRVMREREAR